MAVFLIPDPKAVFIHIPKTGGTSIRNGFFEGNVQGPKQGLVPDEWQEYFKFAFVRNPYDRLISAWRMFHSGMDQTHWQHPSDRQGISLPEFLDVVGDESIPFAGRRETTESKIRHHAIPQTHPFNCLEYADFVGRYENLQSDFEQVCLKLGIEPRRLPHWNRTDREASYMECFESETLARANELYQVDFELLGYPIVSESGRPR